MNACASGVLSTLVLLGACQRTPSATAIVPVAPMLAQADGAATPPPPAEDATVVVAGDAATNPACKLATIAEMQRITGLQARDMLGTTAGGSYSDATYSCTWHFEDTDIQAPAVVVSYETMPRAHPELAAYDTSLIGQHGYRRLDGDWDIGIFAGHSSEVLAGRLHAFVRAQLHNDPEEADLNQSILDLVVPRMPHPDKPRGKTGARDAAP